MRRPTKIFNFPAAAGGGGWATAAPSDGFAINDRPQEYIACTRCPGGRLNFKSVFQEIVFYILLIFAPIYGAPKQYYFHFMASAWT